MNTKYLPGILAMAAVVVASISSSVPVRELADVGGVYLSFGVSRGPMSMNRVYGVQAARRVVFIGFLVGIGCSLIGTQIVGEFGPLVTLRIAVGSGVRVP